MGASYHAYACIGVIMSAHAFKERFYEMRQTACCVEQQKKPTEGNFCSYCGKTRAVIASVPRRGIVIEDGRIWAGEYSLEFQANSSESLYLVGKILKRDGDAEHCDFHKHVDWLDADDLVKELARVKLSLGVVGIETQNLGLFCTCLGFA